MGYKWRILMIVVSILVIITYLSNYGGGQRIH